MPLLFTIITQDQQNIESAEALANEIIETLGNGTSMQLIEPYHKFADSYAIHLEKTVATEDPTALIHLTLSLADLLVSPWLVSYDSDSKKIEMIYNNAEHTQKRKPAFHAIRWAEIL